MQLTINSDGKIDLHGADIKLLDNFNFKYHLEQIILSMNEKPEPIKSPTPLNAVKPSGDSDVAF